MREANSITDADILESVAGELEHIDDDGIRSEEVVTEVDKEAESSESTPDAGPELEVEGEEKAVEEDATPLEKPTEDSTPKDEEPALPDAYKRAAIHMGWKPEDVEELWELDAEKAERTFRNIYGTVNKSSQMFADLGRASKETAKPKPDESGKKRFEYERMDFEALEKDDPDNPLVSVVKGFDNLAANLTSVLNEQHDKLQTSSVDVEAARAKATGDRSVEQTIDNFFRADDMAVYNDLYGKLSKEDVDWTANLTGAQLAKRVELCETANEIKAGAEAQGKDMDVVTALDRAHCLVSKDYQEQAIRERIKGNVKKRSKSLSINPSIGKSKVKLEGTAASRKELEDGVKRGLAGIKW